MKRFLLVLFAVSALTLNAWAVRPDLNAFLNQKAANTAELVAQAKRDPVVMDRYMRHFGMTRDEVIDYLSSLKLKALPEDTVFTIYSVPEGGHIKMHLEKLPQGTKVFALQDGTPQLLVKCGNPLTLGTKQVIALNKIPVTVDETVAKETPLEIVTEVQPETEAVAYAPPAEPTYTFNTGGTEPVQLPVLGGGGFNPLPLALGGLGFIRNGGGGSAPVPEPMTMLALGAGFSALILRRRK